MNIGMWVAVFVAIFVAILSENSSKKGKGG